MRRSLVVLGMFLVVLGAAACGSESSSTGGSTASGEPAASSPEATWAKEVQAEMSYFENHVAAQQLPAIQDTYNQVALEPLYRTYGADLGTLANKLAATKAPAACTALQNRIANTAKRVAQLITELGEGTKLNEKQYSSLLGRQGEKIHDTSIALTELTADPRCR